MTIDEVREIMGYPSDIKGKPGVQFWYYSTDYNKRLEFRFIDGYLFEIR